MSIFKKKSVYKGDVAPACEVCENSAPLASDAEKVLCRTRGIVECDHSCAAFYPDPLKRRPPSRAAVVESVAELVADSAEMLAEFNKKPEPSSPEISPEENAASAETGEKSVDAAVKVGKKKRKR